MRPKPTLISPSAAARSASSAVRVEGARTARIPAAGGGAGAASRLDQRLDTHRAVGCRHVRRDGRAASVVSSRSVVSIASAFARGPRRKAHDLEYGVSHQRDANRHQQPSPLAERRAPAVFGGKAVDAEPCARPRRARSAAAGCAGAGDRRCSCSRLRRLADRLWTRPREHTNTGRIAAERPLEIDGGRGASQPRFNASNAAPSLGGRIAARRRAASPRPR